MEHCDWFPEQVNTRMSHTKSASLCNFSPGGRKQGHKTEALPRFPQGGTPLVNHVPGPCQQSKGFNGTVFWDHGESSVLSARWRSTSTWENRDSCQAYETEEEASVGKIAAPCPPLPASRQTQMQTRVGSCLTKVFVSGKNQMSARVLGELAACCALHIFI